MDPIDLRLLRVLDRLLDRGSVTRAARDLGVGQPTVSRALAMLRDQLGDPLLIRSGSGMVRTQTADALREPVREALRAAEAVLRPPEPFDPGSATGTFRLALGDDVQSWLVVPLLAQLSDVAPGLDLRVARLDLETPAALQRGALDLAVVPDLRALPGLPKPAVDHLVHRPLLTSSFAVASRDGGPWDLDTWCAAPHVLAAPLGDTDQGFVDRLLATHGRQRRVWVSVPSFEQACRIVARTHAVATLPRRIIAAFGPSLRADPMPIAFPTVEQHLLWAPYTTTSARHRFLRELVVEVAREAPEATRARMHVE